MASGFFAVLDDIAALMDDVALASKVATKKTAGILGDDLAVNADKATGFVSNREIPVLWAITKGSFINKLIIVPIALLLNYFFPVAIKVVLVLGGLYLAYEGVEKIIHWIFHPKAEHTLEQADTAQEAAALEKQKIKSAISTDFILSVEIVIIALGTVLDQSLTIQILTVSVVSLVATVGVYGIVALIVRMDDAGYKLIRQSNNLGWRAKLGQFLVDALPVVIRILGVVGTIALILVAGGIFVHNVPFFHHFLPALPGILSEALLGLMGGIVALGLMYVMKAIWHALKPKTA
ncbi:MAG: DUF808 domain-containing protein [Weeksellaceae bacterium]|nr:DUF808 domain-containing protein [Weeksellaceae bacterium]